MVHAADMTQQDGSGLRHDVGGASHDADMAPTGHDDLRVTVEDAAWLLDITVDALRKRIERGTLQSEKVNNTRYVVLDTDMIRHDDILGTAPEHHDTHITHMAASLEEQVAFLRRSHSKQGPRATPPRRGIPRGISRMTLWRYVKDGQQQE